MKSPLPAVVVVVLVLAAILLYASAFVVEEGKQAVITQFGKPVGYAREARLHFRVPFIQKVHLLEERLLPWDNAAASMQTRDKKRIFIDVWARWKIVDLETFFLRVRTEQRGQAMLDNLVNSAVRNVVAQNKLIDVVRSTNDPLETENEELAPGGEATRDTVTTGRAKMEAAILKAARPALKEEHGIELTDLHIKRVNYVESVKQTVYDRMKSERLRIASLYQSEAEEEQNKIEGQTRFELDQIEGEMEQRSAEIRGEADAEVIRLTAEAYGKSPEFYEFLRRLEVLRNTLGQGDTRLILSTDSELFQLFKRAERRQ